jgi:8-amino-7-oxononanoate synthase
MSHSYDDWLASSAAEREKRGLTRRLRHRHEDESLIDVASNDYLGLSTDPRVVRAACDAVRAWGAGSTGSRLVSGSTELHRALELDLAGQLGGEESLLFSSGYAANLGVITALGGTDTLVVSDAGNHASIVDACRLSRSRVVVTPHADLDAVAAALRGRAEPRALVAIDAVFSADGGLAPLAELHDICHAHDALLVLDEAHSVGVVGDGRGLAFSAGLADAPDLVRTVTLSKALGSQGGAVLASAAVTDHLVNTARTFIFDTGLAPASVGAARAALAILVAEPDLVERLRARRDQLASALGVPPPPSAVVSLVLGEPGLAVAVAQACRSEGVLVGCFRPPSVPPGESRVRLTARAALSEVDVKVATDVVLTAIEKLR